MRNNASTKKSAPCWDEPSWASLDRGSKSPVPVDDIDKLFRQNGETIEEIYFSVKKKVLKTIYCIIIMYQVEAKIDGKDVII